MNDHSGINLLVREERRFLCKHPKTFLRELFPLLRRKKFSDREIVENIYLDNDDHQLPFGVSLRIRRYLARRTMRPTLTNHKVFLEYKKTVRNDKSKHRTITTLNAAVNTANHNRWGLGGTVRPFFGIQYRRHHYVPKRGTGFRITIDSDIRYFYFPPDGSTAIAIGREANFARIEIKKHGRLPTFERTVATTLTRTHCLPIISKRVSAYHFLQAYNQQRRPRPNKNELPGIELQVKLEMPRPNERLFHKLMNLFAVVLNGPFERSTYLPEISESASIRRYHALDGGTQLLILQGDRLRVAQRTRSKIIRTASTQGNVPILQCSTLRESVTLRQAYRVLASPLRVEIERKKKVFWVEHAFSHRLYAITLDRTQRNSRHLYQIEILYWGTAERMHAHARKTIIKDLVSLTVMIRTAFPALRPSIRTKSHWAGLDAPRA